MIKRLLLIIFLFSVNIVSIYVSAASWNLPGVSIVGRAQWWANETWRYTSLSKTERDKLRKQQAEDEWYVHSESESKWKIATDYLVSLTPEEQKVDEYRESSDDNYLKWPESIHKNKIKIIIHHTATDYTVLLTGWTWAAIQELQAIYKYHTLTKWWWDIWYHFIIDPFGTIYEWKAGWPWVVWAHTAWNNTPSIGIALMGNFNDNVPTDVSLKSLVLLTTALAKKYSINPKNTATYFKKSDEYPYLSTFTNYTIVGHRDAWITSCPGTNLYNLLPEIRNHVSDRLVTSTLVKMKSSSSSSSKWDKGIVVWDWYYADTNVATFTLPIRRSGVESCTTHDKSISISSCTTHHNQLLLSLEKKGASWLKTISVVTHSWTKKFSFLAFWDEDFARLASLAKQKYINKRSIVSSSSSITKILNKISFSEIKNILQGKIRVLLYDLSVNYPRHEISCDWWCVINADGVVYTWASAVVEMSDWYIYLTLPFLESPLATTILNVSSFSWWFVCIDNYTRKSYAWIPWNVFRGSLIWKKDNLKKINSNAFVQQAVVINDLLFNDYMKWIAETSDSDDKEKQKIILLLAKMYAIFYLGGKNIHPSIPVGSNYEAIDNPEMFQKYVWAWREKTSKMSANILSSIQKKVIMYADYVPILPYFSCSAWFTWSAKEKWWWIDTPYLVSKLDFAACFDFNGHWVWLSWKWAQYLAERWWTMERILQYYYPGTKLLTISD